MKTSLPLFFVALVFICAIDSLICVEAKAQSNAFRTLFHGGTYNSASEREALYDSNAQLPLGGLFAPGFTRTLTLLGGANYPSGGVEDVFNRDGVGSLADIVSGPIVPARQLDDTGYALSFAFGRRHSRTLRSEIEVAFRSNDFDSQVLLGSDLLEPDGNINTTSIMKNFIREFQTSTLFTPYVGVGLGLSYVEVETGEFRNFGRGPISEDGEGAFSYQAIGGVATKLNSFADFIIEYRFLGTSEIDFGGLDNSFSYNTSSFFLGAKFEY